MKLMLALAGKEKLNILLWPWPGSRTYASTTTEGTPALT